MVRQLVSEYRQKMYLDARADSIAFHGDGANVIFIDPQHDIVAVVRWIDGAKMKDFVSLLVEATGGTGALGSPLAYDMLGEVIQDVANPRVDEGEFLGKPH
jgi:hypothetical protein